MKKLLTLIALIVAFIAPAIAQDTGQKINKKNLVIKEWTTDPSNGKKMLDRVTTYNSDGKKVEEIEYGSDGQKWRKRYEYAPGADGKCLKESVYDERNRLNTVKKYEYNEFGRKKTQYNYNAKGKLLTVKVFEYITEDA